MDVAAVLRSQMALGSSQNVLSSSLDVPEGTGYFVGTLQGQNAQGKMQRMMIASKSSDLWWNKEINQLPTSFAGLTQIYSEKTATPLKFIALILYSFLVGCPNLSKRRTRYLIDHGYTFLWFLLVGLAKLGVEDGNRDVDESVSLWGLTSSNVVPVVH